jgi:hypothetical protein
VTLARTARNLSPRLTLQQVLSMQQVMGSLPLPFVCTAAPCLLRAPVFLVHMCCECHHRKPTQRKITITGHSRAYLLWLILSVIKSHELLAVNDFFFLRHRDMGLAGNPHRHPLQAAFCKHDRELKFETNLKLIIDHAPK